MENQHTTKRKSKASLLFFTLMSVFVLLANTASAQLGWEWAKQITNGGNAYAVDLTHDRNGNVYVLGRYSGDLTVSGVSISTGNQLAYLPFVAKFTSAGGLIWMHSPVIGQVPDIIPTSIVVDSNSNVYYGGFSNATAGSVYFASGNDTTFFLAGTAAVNEKYGFITRLNSAGVAKWANRFKCEKGSIDAMKLALNRYRNKLYFAFSTTTTNTSYTSAHYSPGPTGSASVVTTGLGNCDNTGFREAFYGQVDINNGTYIASQRIGISGVGQTGQEYIKGLAADNSGNLIIACDFVNNSAFTYAGGSIPLTPGNANRYGRLFRVNSAFGGIASSGNIQLSTTIPTSVIDVAVHKVTDEVVYAYEGGSFATQPTRIYVRGMNSSFTDIWQNDIASSGYNSQIAGRSLCFDSTGRVWLAIGTNGAGAESMNFTPAFTAASTALNPIDNANYGTLIFRLKYTSGANAAWEKYVKVKHTGSHTLRLSGFDDRINAAGRFSDLIYLSKNTFNNGGVGTDGYVAKIGCAPIVAKQPLDSSICVNNSHSLSAVVDGDAVSYAWYKNNVLVANSGNVSGATATTLSFVIVTAADTGYYKLIATNSCGSDTSIAAHLAFSTAVTITSPPQNQTACVGGAVRFTIVTSPFCTYQWKKNNVNIGGATDDTLLIPSVAYSDSGNYTCFVTNCNGATLLSSSVKILFTTPSILSNVGLAVHYPMGNGVIVNDVSGNGLNLASAGMVYTPDRNATASGALQVPSQTSVNSAAPIASFTNQITMSCWIKSTSISSNQRLIDKNNTNNFLMDIYLSRPRVIMLGAVYHPTNTLSSNTWYHLACTYDGANVRQYINGVLVLTTAATGNITNNANPLYIGCDQNGNNVLQGAIDEVRIFNRSLNATEVSALMAAPAISLNPVNVSACAGNSATFTVAGLGSNLYYQWRKDGSDIPNATTASLVLNSLALSDSGNYSCVVFNGCSGAESKSAKLTLAANNISFATQPTAIQDKCVGTSVSFSATTSGAAPTSYVWKKNGLTLSNGGTISGATTATLTISTVTIADTGNYTLTVNGGSCGAIVSNIGRLNVNALPVAAISPTTVSICAGSSASLTASGGSTYAWSNSLGSNAVVSVSPILATTYTVTVSDVNNCSASTSRLVSVNAVPTAAISPTTVTICSGVSTTLTASGGGTYSWSNSGGSNAAATFSPTGNTTYTVTVSNGTCTATATRLVTVNQLPTIAISPSTISICNGSSASLTASGAANYVWSNGGGTNALATFSPSISSTYSVTGTDANNCTASASRLVTVNQLPAAAISPATVAICAGSSASLSASGGTTYAWSNLLGNNAVVSVSPTINTTYTVTVSDANCSATVSKLVTVNQLPTVSISPTTPVICQGVASALVASGASTYTWSNALGNGASKSVSPSASATYSVTGTDANNCTASASKLVTVNDTVIITQQPVGSTLCQGAALNISTTAIGTGLTYQWKLGTNNIPAATGSSYSVANALTTMSGSYTVVVTGTCGNKISNAATITVNPTTAITTQPVTQTTCAGSNVNFTVVANGANLTYQWKKNTVNIPSATSATYTIPSAAAADTGSYTVVVTGSCGSAQTSTQAVLTIVSSASISQQPSAQNTCIGGPLNLSVVGTGGNNTTYQWKKNSVNISGANSTSYTIPSVALSDSGSYSVVITGSCGTVTSNVVKVNVNAIPTASITPATVTICAGDAANLTASGGGTYAWSNSGGTSAAASFSPTTTSTYTVTVTANNCSATASRLVTVNALPTASITPSTAVVVCAGSPATLTAAGGTSYAWSNSGGTAAAATFSPTTTSTYTVTVTANNCSATASKLVTVNALPLATLTPAAPAICAGASQTLTAGGGSSYAWSAGLGSGTTKSVSPTSTTTYTITATDANNCSASASATVSVTTVVAAINGPTTICSGLSATLTASGGGTYAWSNSLGNAAAVTVSPTTATTYTVTVTNNSCTATASQTVSVQSAPTAVINGASSVCAGSSITLTANGGNTYTWSNGGGTSASATFSPTTATTYTVTASLGAGCTATATKNITIKQPTSGSYNQTICFGQSVVFNGISRSQSGAYLDTIVNIAGCDSFLTLNLTVRPQITGSIAQTVCFGGSTTFNGATLTQSGVFKDTLTSVTGCDSILTLTFTVRPRIATSITQPICNGSAITFNGQTITTAGTYLDTVTSVNGCDSFITLNVTIAQATAATISKSACGSYSFGGNTLTASGTYLDTISNVAGCDSVITLNLTINQATASTMFDTICNGDSYSFGVQTLNQSGAYNRTITNAAGCDSVITLNLFVRPAVAVTASASGFNVSATAGFVSYQWKLNGSTIGGANAQAYSAVVNGTYTVEVTDANGCKGTSNAVNVTGVGIEDLLNFNLSIYPNPATDIITIVTDEQVSGVELFSAIGQKINVTTNTKQQINISDLAAGAYSLIIHTTNGNALKRFVKE